MQKKIWIMPLLIITVHTACAQDRYFTKTAKIYFLSTAPLETIEAANKTASAVIDIKTGAVQVSVLMKGFEFKKALMQEHFNENYVESDKYPKADFKGSIANNNAANYSHDTTFTTTAKGQLTMHGITKTLDVPVTFSVKGGNIISASTFNVLLSDYKISIPAIVKDNLSNSVKVTINATLSALK